MSGRTTSLRALAPTIAPRRALVAQTVAVADLDAATRDAAYFLFRAAYEGTSRERFDHDLAEKALVILLRDRDSHVLKGFSTVLVREIDSPTAPATIVFSGDTVIDPEYWGQKQLQLAFARLLARRKLAAPRRTLYWFLLSKGYRTYLLLANAFPRSVPRAGVADDPTLRATLDALAVERYGAQYDAAAGLVRYDTPHERVRSGLAPVTSSVLANGHVRFFVERNPEHVDGVELACLAEVRLRDLARTTVRLTFARMLRVLGLRPTAR